MVQALNDMYTACLCRHCLSMNYCILDLTLKETVFVMLSFTFHQGTFESPCIAKTATLLRFVRAEDAHCNELSM